MIYHLLVTLNISEDRRRFLASPSLSEIYLPLNPGISLKINCYPNFYLARSFTYSGPVDFTQHYSIPGFLRCDAMSLKNIMSLIGSNKYFVLHEQRQSGKTSYLRDLRDELNSMGEYAALYINVEAAQQEIVNVARRLEAEGKIIIARGGSEDAMV